MNLFKPQTEQFIKNAEDKETLKKNTRKTICKIQTGKTNGYLISSSKSQAIKKPEMTALKTIIQYQWQ